MSGKSTVEEYIRKHERWSEALKVLREIIRSTGLEETLKWGAPTYTLEGKNVVGLGAFKSYVGMWFFQGALLKDEQQKLINAQEGKTRAMRQWRFQSVDEIREQAETIRAYVEEAITNQREGREIKPRRDKPLIIPEPLASSLAGDGELKRCFEALSRSRQREYAEYIAEAKREETRQKRLEKIIPLILAGKGLNDRYRK